MLIFLICLHKNISFWSNIFVLILVTAASSNDDGVGKTKLNFKYVMENEGEKQNVIMQLTPKEFYKLLHELDRAKGNLQSLTGGSATSSWWLGFSIIL